MDTTTINNIYYSKVPQSKYYKVKTSILKKVRSYITPQEIDFYHKECRGLPDDHIKDINKMQDILIEQFGNLPIEPIVLACIVFEMDVYFYRTGKDRWSRTYFSKQCLSGAHKFSELLSANPEKETVKRITFEIMRPRD